MARRLAAALALLFVLTPCALIWLPWRQSVSGAGRVVGYAPLDRQYNIEAPIYGRVQEWFVAEGTKVVKGQPIARISDNDSEYLAALESQRDAARAKLATSQSEVELYREITTRIKEVREMAVNAAENYVDVSKQKVQAEGQEQAGMLVARDTDWQQFQRLVRLFPQGLTSKRDLELAEQKYKESAAKLGKAEAALRRRASTSAKGSYLAEVKAKTQADIEKNRAETQKAMGKVAEAQKELQDAQVKIRRQETQQVVATRGGTILRLLVNQGPSRSRTATRSRSSSPTRRSWRSSS
jgi:multidrug efflux pump subunit AcrA (membrane-fusion protein)